MKIETKLNIGDVVYTPSQNCGVDAVTVGQIKVTITDSPGLPDEEIFDNYKAKKSYSERCMCVETGIGSGTVYTLGENIFIERKDAQAVADERAKREAKRIMDRKIANKKDKISTLEHYREVVERMEIELAEIEAAELDKGTNNVENSE